MKKSAQVVMLSTNEKANIWLDNFGTGLYNCPTGATGVIYQHLYILSDEEIKEGDWVYDVCDGIVKVEHEYQLSYIMVFKKDCKKIIATTDRSLGLVVDQNGCPMQAYSEFLPQIPQSFIEKFVEEYNKGNVITEVMVEYENIDMDFDPTEQNGIKWQTILKINSDNTIDISMPKDSWSREEVVELLYKHTEYMLSGKKDTLDKWIEENL